MIEVRLIKEQDKIVGFLIEGHSGYDEIGRDIVCASVSALSYTAVFSIDKFGVGGMYTENSGYAKFVLNNKNTYKFSDYEKRIEDSQLIMKIFELGLEKISEEYREYIVLR